MTEATHDKPHFSDPELMRVLAHPARLDLIDHLHTVEDATATECAEVVGLSPSALSYHLRALAKVGLVEAAPGRGDGRERVWRLKARSFSIGADYRAPESAKLAQRTMIDSMRRRGDEKFARWMDKAHDEPKEWYDAAMSSEWALLMTAEELAEFNRRLADLTRPYRVRQRKASGEVPDGARRVAFQLRFFPEV
ncbi:helix-turn-helix domain-containing protein [Stackebrandtia nassauensis]|uniref:Transcriptional regulator, ArsR family n=1 Tax=Stackebrandtia nassauensis (strain DSM 44728 / CIP 108903 / NRRL B-16338 / NBRC 102104 / LLR-40K-21) TaxID=446470 RepID=D3QBB8_STANL|nr:helix-turn-helix domain-containing protein [Stackebrandtia nassauensis]ADD40935.1 transcriptional regulator, ArsR family [Stackebrandtia nassauensis DSM 44728]